MEEVYVLLLTLQDHSIAFLQLMHNDFQKYDGDELDKVYDFYLVEFSKDYRRLEIFILSAKLPILKKIYVLDRNNRSLRLALIWIAIDWW